MQSQQSFQQTRGTARTSQNKPAFVKKTLPASFSLFQSIQQLTVDTVDTCMLCIKFCKLLDSNRRPLVLEATALQTEPQPHKLACVHCRQITRLAFVLLYQALGTLIKATIYNTQMLNILLREWFCTYLPLLYSHIKCKQLLE